jgi:hypothetical protein
MMGRMSMPIGKSQFDVCGITTITDFFIPSGKPLSIFQPQSLRNKNLQIASFIPMIFLSYVKKSEALPQKNKKNKNKKNKSQKLNKRYCEQIAQYLNAFNELNQ